MRLPSSRWACRIVGRLLRWPKSRSREIGVVTNVAPVHLEFFKSVAEIARAKYELVESLPAGGTAILNADDEYVSQFGRDFQGKVVLYGLQCNGRHPGGEYRATRRGRIGVRRRHRRRSRASDAASCGQAQHLQRTGGSRGRDGARVSTRTGSWRTGNSGSRGQTGGGRPSGQHHHHQRLLQFQSNSLKCNGGHPRHDACEKADCDCRRDAGARSWRRRTAPAVRPAHGGKGNRSC